MRGSHAASADIDLGLAVLEVLTPPGIALNLREIADVCGCTWQNIYQIEQKALRKLRLHLQRQKNAELNAAFRDMLAVGNTARSCSRGGQSHYARRAA